MRDEDGKYTTLANGTSCTNSASISSMAVSRSCQNPRTPSGSTGAPPTSRGRRSSTIRCRTAVRRTSSGSGGLQNMRPTPPSEEVVTTPADRRGIVHTAPSGSRIPVTWCIGRVDHRAAYDSRWRAIPRPGRCDRVCIIRIWCRQHGRARSNQYCRRCPKRMQLGVGFGLRSKAKAVHQFRENGSNNRPGSPPTQP